jgi:hypothetical protein
LERRCRLSDLPGHLGLLSALAAAARRFPVLGYDQNHALNQFRLLMDELMSAEGTIPAVRGRGRTVVRVPAQA